MEISIKAYLLGVEEKSRKRVCPRCVETNSIIYEHCHKCHGNGFVKERYLHFSAHKNPTEIVAVSRAEHTGKLRYWLSQSEFYDEETYNADNVFMPDVPYGIHFVHFTKEEAEREAKRINRYLESGI